MRLSHSFVLAAVSALGLFRGVVADTQAKPLSYEYIVVGSGPGGGTVAVRLARAGHSVLLIEAGDDQGTNLNYTIPAFSPASTADPKMSWEFYVEHYQDLTRAERDPKFVYDIGNGQKHVGPNPPSGSTPLGILYPRAETLGGCAAHNALVWITPHASDWNGIANITGDSSWAASNMDTYLNRVYSWLSTGGTDPSLLDADSMLMQHYLGGAATMGLGPTTAQGTPNTTVAAFNSLLKNPNGGANDPTRDAAQGFYQIQYSQQNGVRESIRDLIVATVAAGYPLTVRTNAFVTKVNFNTSGSTPRATGVSFLDGAHLYRASPLSGGTGTPGVARATREVIVAGGTFNTPQLLKLSGIGPKAELAANNITTLVNLPGVGKNMQDRYEVPVSVVHPNNFEIVNGCEYDGQPDDLCFQQWINNPNGPTAARGIYASNGLAAGMAVHSKAASTPDIDLYIFGGAVNFYGYYPGWPQVAAADHMHWTWYMLKAHSRNTAGTVTLRSADPLDVPAIQFNYFDTGTTAGGADQLDLATLVQGVKTARQALQLYGNYSSLNGTTFTEEKPGPTVQTDAQIEQWVKDFAWGHHACCTAPMGAASDPNAVLDSQMRVRGTTGLRVVDASVFPKIPGIFLQSPIYMMAEKAADAILAAAH